MKRKCSHCKENIDSENFKYEKTVCDECYAKAWDAGFEASMEYSDMMMERDKKRQEEKDEATK